MSDVSVADRLRNLPQYLLPQRLSSRCIYALTRVRAPWFKNRLIRVFSRRFGVNLGEAESADPNAYPHFNAFFTRALRPSARPLAAPANALCSPVDGAVSQLGTAAGGRLLQAKGRDYSLGELLGDERRAQPFLGGPFITLYLSPRDYHRIHMPLAGRLCETVHIPGRLFSVSPLTTRVVPQLFARNERLVSLFDTAAGPLALVMVGAINVGSMQTVWAGQITPPYGRPGRVMVQSYPAAGETAVALAKGMEMGRFNMGSTVILLFAPGAASWSAALAPGAPVKMGQQLGEVLVDD